MQLFLTCIRVCVVMMIMPGMMETTGIGRFIKLSTATVYTVAVRFIIYIAFSKISKIMPKTGKPYSGLAPKIPRAHTFFINTTFYFNLLRYFNKYKFLYVIYVILFVSFLHY